MGPKTRRNISIDTELHQWLGDDVTNASELVTTLLRAYRAHGGDEIEAARYVVRKRASDISVTD